MKSLTKLVSAALLLVLVLAAFPAMGTTTARAATCDWAQFIADVTVPDGTTYTPGTTFRKTWRLKNIGACTWTTSYALVFDSGEKMGAPTAVNIQSNVAPGQTVDLYVDMTAPSSAGHYFSYWKLRNASNVIFGIGYTAKKAFWAEINVSSSAGTGYDFTANANSTSVTWSSGAGALTFPGTDGDAKGFGLKKDKPKFESSIESGNPGLLMAPQNVYNGYIQAAYPAYRVQTGDRFQATIGCEYGATTCYVAYRLDYQIGSGPVRTFWSFREKYEGWTYNVNLNLNSLAGYDVKFILVISAYGSATGDRALWGNPVISRPGGVIPTFTPTVTGTPPTPTATSTAPTPTSTIPVSACDKAQFIADITVPDGTTFAAATVFDKVWRLKNVGSCTWTSSYQLVYYSGEKMGGPDSLKFPDNKSVAPGQTVDITVRLTAPNTAGTYRGYWMFKNASGALFGIGVQANKPWWVEIKVSGTSGTTGTPTATATATATGTQQMVNARVYFTDKNRLAAGKPPFEIAVWRSVPLAKQPEGVLTEFFKGPTDAEKALGLEATLSGFIGFSKLEIKDGVARVYLLGTCAGGGAAYTIAQPLTVNLKQFSEIAFVKIYDANGSTKAPDGQSDSLPACLAP